jgi:aminobenzoyl-glutamate utilization protein B
MTTSDLAAASAGVKIKDRVRATINERRMRFIELAQDIHQRPELAFSEMYAADRITSVLSQEGFTVLRGVGGLPTAFTGLGEDRFA